MTNAPSRNPISVLVDVRKPRLLAGAHLHDFLVELDFSFPVGFGKSAIADGLRFVVLGRGFLALDQVGEVGGVVGCVLQSGLLRRGGFSQDGSQDATERIGSVYGAGSGWIVEGNWRLLQFNELGSC